jgi:hypothetical protein
MWARRIWTSERPFLLVLAGGLLVRVLVQIAFPPAFVFADGPAYLRLVDDLSPRANRTIGYGFLLRGIAWFTRDVWAVAIVQHLLGLVIAVVIYALLRRRGVSTKIATLATLPVLFDSMELSLEHSALSDVFFMLLLVLAIAVLGWWPRPTAASAAAGGLLLGLSVCVRVVSEPVVVVGVVFCLAAAVGLRRKLATSLVLLVAYAVPVVAYAAWYHDTHGVWALTQSNGRSLYMRTTSFVDCAKITVPSYEQKLCPKEPVGQRADPTVYGWHSPDRNHGLTPPPGVGINQAFRDFAITAIKAQPAAYAEVVARDALMSFFPARFDAFGYDTAHKWSFGYFVDFNPTHWNAPTYAAHGGEQPWSRQPLADVLAIYGYVVFLPGPVILALLVLAIIGLVRRDPPAEPGIRPLIFLVVGIGLGLAWEPDVVGEFTWRYQLPLVILAPVAAALAWSRLRSGKPVDASDETRRSALTGAGQPARSAS